MEKKLIASGEVTIYKQYDAYSVFQSVSEYIFSTDNSGKILNNTSFTSHIKVYLGDIEIKNFNIGSIQKPNGFTSIVVNNTNKSITYTVNTNSSILPDSGIVIIPVSIGDKYIELSFSFAKAKQGKNGADSNLEWVKDWDTNKTQIDGESVITPKIFAGQKNADNTITGVAIGNFSLSMRNSSETVKKEVVNGIYGFRNGYKNFSIDSDGNIEIGRGDQIIRFDALKGKIEFGKDVTLNWQDSIDEINNLIEKEDWSNKLTYIGSTGIFTGTLSANTVKAVKIDASQITSGLINANRINVAELKSSLITAGNIEALEINVIQGTIGGWKIDKDAIYTGTKNNISGFTSASGSITIGTVGIRGHKWRLETSGSGVLAGGNILWDVNGNVTFSEKVSVNWTNAANSALTSAKTYADTKKAEAISTAATDATTKTNLAKELAQGMAFGKMLYRDPTFINGVNSLKVYNNSGNGMVVLTRVTDNTAPNDSKFVIKIVNKGTSTPGLGGFLFGTACKNKKVYICRIIAKVPIGRSIGFATNSIGTGGTNKWLTSNAGTGDWCEYIHKVSVGTGTLQTTHYYYIPGTDFGTAANPVEWYLAYCTVFDLTENENLTTTITSEGIYTSSITASQITAGTIDTARLNVEILKSQLITAGNINALKCTFDKGTIGGWNIGTDNITYGSIGSSADNNIPIQIRTKASGSGYWYSGAYKPYGICMTWHKSSNAGHLVIGQIAASGNTVKTGFAGLQMMGWQGQEYFCLSVNHGKVGSQEVYNRIAGWGFDQSKIWKNNVTLGADGSIGHSSVWKLNNDGSGSLANGNISWNASGVVTFGSSVSLNWTNAANSALNSAKTYADTKKSEAISAASTDATTKSELAKELARAMAFGKMLFRVPEFYVNGAIHYNGTSAYCSNGTRTIEKVSGCPNTSGYALKITATNWHASTDLRISGFAFKNQSRANAVFIARIIALIPVGRKIQNHHNNYGTGQHQKWLTSQEGTGKWEEYICKVNCGSSGTFSTVNHFTLTGGVAPTAAVPVVWYVAFATIYDVTSCESYTTTIDVNGIYTGMIKANQIHIDSALVVGGTTYNGSISVRNAGNVVMATLDRRGITAIGGTIAGWTISSNQISKGGVILGSDGTISNGSKWKLDLDGSGYVGNGNISWTKDGDVNVVGKVDSKTGTIGGFEIGEYRIGEIFSTNGGELSIYKDCIRVGDSNSCVWIGKRVSALSSNLHVSSKIMNKNTHDSNIAIYNVGLELDISGAALNFGIISNAAIVAPIINRGIQTFSVGSTFLDFSQCSVFFFYGFSNQTIGLPSESSVKLMFNRSILSSDFGIEFKITNQCSYNLTIKNVYNTSWSLGSITLTKGQTIFLLCSGYPSFRYIALMKS